MTAIHQMRTKELAFANNDSEHDRGALCNIGVLGSDVGSGKSAAVLHLVQAHPLVDVSYKTWLEQHTLLPTCLCALVADYVALDWAARYHRIGFTGAASLGPRFYMHRWDILMLRYRSTSFQPRLRDLQYEASPLSAPSASSSASVPVAARVYLRQSLLVVPFNLMQQWQAEMAEWFRLREHSTVVLNPDD